MKNDAVRTNMQQTPRRSLSSALDMTEEEMRKPPVSIVSSCNEMVPGHISLDKIVGAVKLGVATTGGTPVVFPTIAVYDDIAMGYVDMKYSLVTRNLIADSTGCMALTHQSDMLVVVLNCDRNVPGLLMAATRINVPIVFVSGGPMLAGHVKGYEISLSSISEAVGAYTIGSMSEEDVKEFENKACPTYDSCSGMYTANSMSCSTEVLDMGLRGNGTTPVVYSERVKLAKHADMKVIEIYERNAHPRDIMIKEAFMSTLTMDMALGYSTNNMLCPPVVAYEAGVGLNVDITSEISARTPSLCHSVPTGPTYIEDLNEAGGVYAVMKKINKKRLLSPDYMTVTGGTVGENIKSYISRNPGVTRPVENPYNQTGGITILKSSLTPDSAMVKCSTIAPKMLEHEGPARVLDYEGDAINAIENGRVVAEDVVVIHYEGPKGGPNMRGVLDPVSVVTGMGLSSTVALITGGRFSGASRGASISHALSEAAMGDPIALVEEGDIISIDIDNRELNMLASDQEMEVRKAKWRPRTPQVTTGYLAGYASLVTSADRGAVL